MVDSPNIWYVGVDIVVDLFVGDPNTGQGLTGQSAFITLTIEKASTGLFYNGTDHVAATPYALTMTEVDATNSPGLYRYTLPAAANTEVDKYYMHTSVSNPPTIEGDDYSIHDVRDDHIVRVYESEPILS